MIAAELVAKVGAPVGLVFLLRLAGILALPPPGAWQGGFGSASPYLMAVVGSAFAKLFRAQKIVPLIVGVVLVVTSALSYLYLIEHAPTVDWATCWTAFMDATFLLTYLALGFVVSVALSMIWKRASGHP